MSGDPAASRIEKLPAVAVLLDHYGALLTDRQQQALSLFYEEDLSLSEIGKKFSISRQAVHDAIRHGETQLAAYEDALHLREKTDERRRVVELLRQKLGADQETAQLLDRLL